MSRLEDKMLARIRLAGLPEPEREYKFMPNRQYRSDFAWTTRRLILEVEGGTWMAGKGGHTSGVGESIGVLAAVEDANPVGWHGLVARGDNETENDERDNRGKDNAGQEEVAKGECE